MNYLPTKTCAKNEEGPPDLMVNRRAAHLTTVKVTPKKEREPGTLSLD
jgi:hypothetical protein